MEKEAAKLAPSILAALTLQLLRCQFSPEPTFWWLDHQVLLRPEE